MGPVPARILITISRWGSTKPSAWESGQYLSYMVDPGASGVTFKMSILNPGATEIVPSTTLPAQSGHVRQEVIDANVLKKTGNTLRIQVTAGSASFSDMVLMHQSTV